MKKHNIVLSELAMATEALARAKNELFQIEQEVKRLEKQYEEIKLADQEKEKL